MAPVWSGGVVPGKTLPEWRPPWGGNGPGGCLCPAPTPILDQTLELTIRPRLQGLCVQSPTRSLPGARTTMFSPPRLVSSLSLSVQPSDAQIWETFPSTVEEGNEPRGETCISVRLGASCGGWGEAWWSGPLLGQFRVLEESPCVN